MGAELMLAQGTDEGGIGDVVMLRRDAGALRGGADLMSEEAADPWEALRPPPELAFGGGELKYIPAPALAAVGARLIQRYRAFGFLQELSVDYLWQAKGTKAGGKRVLGQCSVLKGLGGYYCRHDFVIALAADHIRELLLPPRVIEAIVFHELCHCDVDDKGRPTVRSHDWAGFRAEVEAYGLYLADMRAMDQAFRQLRIAEVAE